MDFLQIGVVARVWPSMCSIGFEISVELFSGHCGFLSKTLWVPIYGRIYLFTKISAKYSNTLRLEAAKLVQCTGLYCKKLKRRP